MAPNGAGGMGEVWGGGAMNSGIPTVLHVVNSFNQGGSERQAVQLIRLLHETGRYRICVAVQNDVGPLRADVARIASGGIARFPLTSFYDRNALHQWRQFRRFVREHKVDIVHTHDFYTNVFGMFGAAAGPARVRIASRRETAGTRSRAQKIVERFAYRFAKAIVANGEAVRSFLIAEGVPSAKIEVIHNSLDVATMALEPDFDRTSALERLRLPLDRKHRFVTMVANMRLAVKDHPMFLRAAKQVSMSIPEAMFVVAGEGELTESVRAMARGMGLVEKVHFIGECEHVAELLAVSDVCALSSKAEGLSNAILEYMAAARPAVVTDVGAAREIVTEGETGHLVPSGDSVTMAARIIALLQDPARAARIGEAARQSVIAKFSCEARLARTERLYERLLSARSPATQAYHRSEPDAEERS